MWITFITRYKNKILGLYERRSKIETMPTGSLGLISASIFNIIPSNWNTGVVLEFIDEKGNNIWTFPDVKGLRDLLNSVKYQIAGVDDFLNDLFENKGE